MTDLSGKTILVTARESSKAKHLVDALVERGAKVVAAAVSVDGQPEQISWLDAESVQAVTVTCDLLNEAQVRKLVHRTVHRFGRIDALVNLGDGQAQKIQLVDCPTPVWENILKMNLRSAFWLCREVAPAMERQGSGVMVNVCAAAPGRAAYSAGPMTSANAALGGFSRALAAELVDSGVGVFCIEPEPFTGRKRGSGRGESDSDERLAEMIGRLIAAGVEGRSEVCIQMTRPALSPPASESG